MARLSDRGFTSTRGLSYTLEDTATNVDGAFPASHGLGAVPSSLELWVEVSAGEWEQHDASTYVTASSTALTSTGTTLASVVGGATNVRLVAAAGAVALSVAEASASQAGIVSTGTQTFGGAKTFSDGVRVGSPTLSSPLIVKSSGIGSSGSIQLESSTTTDSIAQLGDFTGGNIGYLRLSASTEKVLLLANGDSFLNGGNVGIGTSIPADKLHLLGTGETGIRIGDSGTARYAEMTFGTTNGALLIGSQGGTPYPIEFQMNGTEVASIASTGAVTLGPAPVAATNGVLHRIATGDQASVVNLTTAQAGYMQVGNSHPTLMAPAFASVTSDNNISAMAFFAAASDTNNIADMVFDVRENDNTDFATLTNKAFRFTRIGNELLTITRAGAVTLGPSGGGVTHQINGATNFYGFIRNVTANADENTLGRSTPSTTKSVASIYKWNVTDETQTHRLLIFSIDEGVVFGNSGGIQSTKGGTPSFFSGSSDRRTKTIIGDMQPTLDKLCQVEMKEFTYKKTGIKAKGPIAQQLFDLFPEKVITTDNGLGDDVPEGVEPWTVSVDWDYELIKAIQELNAKVEALEAQLTP